MPDHNIKRGLNIPIEGRASGDVVTLPLPATVAIAPTELRGLTPRLATREGDAVQRGDVLFFDKSDERLVVRSPVSGQVAEVRRGHRRVITDVVITVSGDQPSANAPTTVEALANLDRDGAEATLLASGFWPCLRQRPLSNMPRPGVAPQAIVIGATESGPLMPGADVLLSADDKPALQAAITLLGKLGKVLLTKPSGAAHPALAGLTGVEEHGFSGPHPSGDVPTQINLIAPCRPGAVVWYLSAWDAAALGHTLLSGKFYAERVYAAVGVGCKQPRFVRTVVGAPLAHIVGDVREGQNRFIRGSILTGESVDGGRWASMLTRGVHVLPDEVPRYLLGWALPSLGAWSFHKAFVSGLLGQRKDVDLRPGIYGGERALVPIGGVYERVVVTPDILPEFLVKALHAGDMEESLSLGMLDLTEEEAALCTFVCPSKIEFDVLLKRGLEQYQRQA